MKGISLKAKDGAVRAHALVDDEDFDWLNRWHWSLAIDGYVARMLPSGRHTMRMSRQILRLRPGDLRQADHINRNPLDHRRSNLRIAQRGHADNNQNKGLAHNNTSGYRGVSKRGHRWLASATLNRKKHYLGVYDTPEQADAVVRAWRAEHMPFSDDALAA